MSLISETIMTAYLSGTGRYRVNIFITVTGKTTNLSLERKSS